RTDFSAFATSRSATIGTASSANTYSRQPIACNIEAALSAEDAVDIAGMQDALNHHVAAGNPVEDHVISNRKAPRRRLFRARPSRGQFDKSRNRFVIVSITLSAAAH